MHGLGPLFETDCQTRMNVPLEKDTIEFYAQRVFLFFTTHALQLKWLVQKGKNKKDVNMTFLLFVAQLTIIALHYFLVFYHFHATIRLY